MRVTNLLSLISLSLLFLGVASITVSGEAPTAGRSKSAPPLGTHSDPLLLSPAAFDTAWFGGTRWDAADARWEAIRDSVWTFDTGVGSSINGDPGLKPVGSHATMEGWVGADYSPGTYFSGRFRRLSETDFSGSPCVGSAAGLGGDWSFWVGLRESELPACWVGGRGYGSRWSVSIRQTFQATGAATTLSYAYKVDCEDDYDFVTVHADTGGGPVLLVSYTGTGSGSEAMILNPGIELPSGAGPVTLIFRFDSDGYYDDQDGIFPTQCGAFAVDNIVLTGGIVHSADFETGPGGWVETSESMPAGDFSDLEALADLPLPWVAMPSGCGPADTALVFNDTSTPGDFHPDFQQNLAWSPWIDVTAEGLLSYQGIVISTQGFFDQEIDYNGDDPAVLMYLGVDWVPRDPCDSSQWELLFDIAPPRWFCENAPFIKPMTACGTPVCTSLLPPGVTRFRVGVGAQLLCFHPSGECVLGNPDVATPWYDNIRVGVLHAPILDVENLPPGHVRAFLDAVRPNPVRPGTSAQVTFQLRETQPILIEVLDVAGRRVAVVFDDEAGPGRHEVTWNGTDASGRDAPGGIYFLRMATEDGAQVRKVALIP